MKPTMSNQFVSVSAAFAERVLAAGEISFCTAKIINNSERVLWTVHKSGRRIPIVTHPEGCLALAWVGDDGEIEYRKISRVVAQALIDMHGS